MSRRRADTLLAERGLAPSRSAAAESVRAGRVRLGDHGPAVAKPSQLLPDDAELVVESASPYVSRGGIKLANALERLPVAVSGRDCLDVGASTGGFTDCLLQRGAARVIALDVGYGQLDWRLRRDPRVIVVERVNARELDRNQLQYAPELVTVDVSFISLAKVLPALVDAAAADADLVALVKPQFELGPERVGRGGVVRESEARGDAIRSAVEAARRTGLSFRGLEPSGLPGPKGNRETFIWCDRSGAEADLEVALGEADV